MKRTRVVLSLMVLAAILTTGAVQAAKPPKPQSVTASCYMTPDPMVAGEEAHLFAYGLPDSVALNVFVTQGDETTGFPVGYAWNAGSLEWIRFTPRHAGTIQVTVTGPERGQTKVYASCGGEVLAAA